MGTYFCNACIARTPLQKELRCIVCQKPSLNGFTHPKCKTKFTPDKLTTLYNYQSFPIARLIISGKYNFIQEVFSIFGTLLATNISFNHTFTFVPIPLSQKRKRWRGFNQSHVIVQKITDLGDYKSSNVLIRTKHTLTQKDLQKQQRLQNIKNAFEVDHLIDIPEMVVLIDDVTTTGSTLIEATHTLKLAGVTYVWCIAIAQD